MSHILEVGMGTFFTLVSGSSKLGKPSVQPMTAACCRRSYGFHERLLGCSTATTSVCHGIGQEGVLLVQARMLLPDEAMTCYSSKFYRDSEVGSTAYSAGGASTATSIAEWRLYCSLDKAHSRCSSSEMMGTAVFTREKGRNWTAAIAKPQRAAWWRSLLCEQKAI